MMSLPPNASRNARDRHSGNAEEFKLYPEEKHWFSFNDYRAVLDTMRQLKPARVLEFGPGSSTLALIEGGAKHIDTCEDNPDWAQVYEERLQGKYPEIVTLHRYEWCEPLSIEAIDVQTYDLALIDGPLGTNHRPAVVAYCLGRCTAVLAPTEDGNPVFRLELRRIAEARGLQLDIRETGPLSGGFALLRRRQPPLPPPSNENPGITSMSRRQRRKIGKKAAVSR